MKEHGELILSQKNKSLLKKDKSICPKSKFEAKVEQELEGENEIKIADVGSQSHKISVCFPEYSFLCSKMFTRTLIGILIIGGFEAIDSEKQELLNSLNKCADTIRACTMRICPKGFKGIDIANYSLFCSMQQILIAIWCAKDKYEFLDIMYEYDVLDGIKEDLSELYKQEESLKKTIHSISWKKKPCAKCGQLLEYNIEWRHPPNFCPECKKGFQPKHK